MKKPKNNNMLMHGFILVTILATAKSAEAEITMEAAFQGHCGHTSPCEQLCYEIHDGMYECDCIEGYELNKNGYSCQVINTTSTNDMRSKSEEDVLYQKGASFSAKLANDDNDEHDENSLSSSQTSSSSSSQSLQLTAMGVDGQFLSASELSSVSGSSSGTLSVSSDEDDSLDAVNYYSDDLDHISDALSQDNQRQQLQEQENVNSNSNDFYISAKNMQQNNDHQTAEQNYNQQVVPEFRANAAIKKLTQRAGLTTARSIKISLNQRTSSTTPKPESFNTEAISNVNMEDDYYVGFRPDMSIYDDVNNNQLNLRPVNHNTYHAVNLNSNEQRNLNKITAKGVRDTASVSSSDGGKLSKNINISLNGIGSEESIGHDCNLDCGADGQCDNSEGTSRCLCQFGKSGSSCAEDTLVRVPKFSKKSWLAFPALRGAYKHVQIRIEFRPEAFDGIILLSGERDDLTGDFMALLLNKGFVEFWFDCGSGVGSVRSRETILLNEWNSVIIYRHRWDAWLVLNHGTKVQGRSNGLFSRITFREPVFLGGTGNITGLAKRLPVFTGFIGCIRRLVANEHEYKFEEHPVGDVTKGFDIQDCITDKCFKYPCQHGGKCLPSDQGAVCLCPIGFVGDLCEIRMDLQVPAFNGSSYLRYAPLGDSALIWLELKVILKLEQPDGLILYSGPQKHGDFIALTLSNGFVEFIFDLGSGPAMVRSEQPLTLGQWHTIKVSRTARLAVLRVDQLPEVMTISTNGFWHLSLPENLFVGGVGHVDKLPMDLKYKSFFVGCIQQIDINGHSLAIISEALGGANIGNCPHACVARPCGPLAECVPQMESYECRCSSYNAACNKAAEVPLEELQLNKVKSKMNVKNQDGLKSKKIFGKKHGKEHARYLHKITLPAATTPKTPKTPKPTTTKSTTTTTTTTTTPKPTTRTTTMTQNRANYENLDFSADEVEDDIIFRDVHGMHKKYVHNKEASNLKSKIQRNDKTIIKRTFGKLEQDLYNNKKPDPHYKQTFIESKLSRMPAHYESFQTNPEGDILTFGDSVELDINLSSEDPTHQQDNDNNNNNNDNDDDDDDNDNDREMDNYGMDSTLFDDNDGTEEYHRKQLVQDMRRIMANPHHDYKHENRKLPLDGLRNSDNHPTPAQRIETPPQISSVEIDSGSLENFDDDNDNTKQIVETNDDDNDDDSDDDSDDDNNDDVDDDLLEPVQLPKVAVNKTTPQVQTDWSSLKKLDLSNEHSSLHPVGVRKNFGACFAGEDSYFHYSDAETMSQIISYTIDLNLRIKTHSNNGVILWTGRQGTTDEDDDYLSLGIENGYLHFRYDLGSGEVDIRFNMTKVSDGLWHRVRAIRNSQQGYLEVDGRKSATQRSPGKLRQLNTDAGLYVGGMPDVNYFTRRRYTSGIVGCISEIVLTGELKLNFDPNTLGTAHNVETGIL